MNDLRNLPSLASFSKEERRKLLRASGTTIYYVYAYLRLNGTPYYVGKGCKGRLTRKYRSVTVPPEDRIVLLGMGLTELEAFELEKRSISEYGRKENGSGLLWNFTDGGEGITGFKHREESKDKIRAKHRNKVITQETRAKISESVQGFKWYTNGKQSVQSFEHPGEGWVEGRIATWVSPTTKGQRWYTKEGVSELFPKDPGDGWVLGRKVGTPRGHRTNTGKKWYNNGSVNQMFEVPPDESWLPGMVKRTDG